MSNSINLILNKPVLVSGLVALSGAISTIYMFGNINLLNALFFGSSSFTINFLLYYPDIRDIDLADIFKNFDFVSMLKLSLAVLAGLLTAIIVFNSTIEVMGVMLFGLTPAIAISSPPPLLLLIGAVLTLSSFIANTALYLNSFNLNNVSYFYDVSKKSLIILDRLYDNSLELFNSLTNLKIKDITNNTIKILADTLMISTSLVLASSIYLLSWGLFKTQVSKVTVDFFKITNVLYQNIIKAVVCFGQILNGLFYADKILKPVNNLGLYIFGKLLNIKTYNINSNGEINNSFEIKKISLTQEALVLAMLICSCSNAIASGKGFMNDPNGISNVSSFFLNSITKSNLALYAFFLGASSSFIANFEKSSEAVLNPSKHFGIKN